MNKLCTNYLQITQWQLPLFGCGHGNQFLSKIGFLAVFFASGTVFISRTAEPSGIGAATAWTYGTFAVLFGIGQPLGCSHGNHFVGKVDFLAVFFTGSTVFISGAAEPSGVGAATAWTYGTITVLLYLFQLPLRCSHSNKFVGIVGFLAVFFTCCTVFISRAAEPSGIGAATTWTYGTFTILFGFLLYDLFGSSH